jgi:hypothetical protein
MRPAERDAAYIWEMLDSARTLHGFVRGADFHNYTRDKKLQLLGPIRWNNLQIIIGVNQINL